MSPIDCLSCGEEIDLQINIDGERLRYEGRVHDIDNGTFSVEIDDEGLRKNLVAEGVKAFLLGQQHEENFRVPVMIESAEDFPVLRIKQNNLRSNVRADGFIRLKYERLDESQFVKKREQYLDEIIPEYATDASVSEIYFGFEGDVDTGSIPPKFHKEISLLNKNLIALQKLILNSEEMIIFEQEPVKVNISGSGMSFESDGCFQVGDLLDLKMVLPTSPFNIIKAVGLIVRIDKLPNRSNLTEPSKYLAIKFLAINEDNMEAIIKCVFTWQRKILRENKVHYAA